MFYSSPALTIIPRTLHQTFKSFSYWAILYSFRLINAQRTVLLPCADGRLHGSMWWVFDITEWTLHSFSRAEATNITDILDWQSVQGKRARRRRILHSEFRNMTNTKKLFFSRYFIIIISKFKNSFQETPTHPWASFTELFAIGCVSFCRSNLTDHKQKSNREILFSTAIRANAMDLLL